MAQYHALPAGDILDPFGDFWRLVPVCARVGAVDIRTLFPAAVAERRKAFARADGLAFPCKRKMRNSHHKAFFRAARRNADRHHAYLQLFAVPAHIKKFSAARKPEPAHRRVAGIPHCVPYNVVIGRNIFGVAGLFYAFPRVVYGPAQAVDVVKHVVFAHVVARLEQVDERQLQLVHAHSRAAAHRSRKRKARAGAYARLHRDSERHFKALAAIGDKLFVFHRERFAFARDFSALERRTHGHFALVAVIEVRAPEIGVFARLHRRSFRRPAAVRSVAGDRKRKGAGSECVFALCHLFHNEPPSFIYTLILYPFAGIVNKKSPARRTVSPTRGGKRS